MIIFDQNGEIALWVARNLGMQLDPHTSSAIGFMRNGELIAGALYTNWMDPNIELSFAATSPRWATKENIFTILSYPFLQLGCRRISAICKIKNKRVRKLLEGVGFVHEGRLRHWCQDGSHGLVYGLTKEDFFESKWSGDLGGKNGQGRGQRPTSAAA